MMKSFVILNILVSVYVGGQSSPWPTPNWENSDCCEWKVVGGVKYKLVDQSNQAWFYNCSSNCTYKTVDNDGDDTLYCFKPGALESGCYSDHTFENLAFVDCNNCVVNNNAIGCSGGSCTSCKSTCSCTNLPTCNCNCNCNSNGICHCDCNV